jgi:PleD family two-component response regulator
LLLGCDAGTATEVIDRLRDNVTHDCTCSAGITIKQPGESPTAVVVRADAAFYRAKSQGRDQSKLAETDDVSNAHNRIS